MSEPVSAPLSQEDEVLRRTARLEKITAEFGNPFHVTRFDKTHSAATIKKQHEALENGEKTDRVVSIAGRVMSFRNNGMFIDLQDDSDRIQVFHDIKNTPAEKLELLKLLDLGDIIGVSGKVRRTPRGEITVDAAELTVLSKALEPPPEKYHGLKDVETRFRHREQDIATSQKTRDTLRARFKMIAAIRQFLNAQDFLEVETPMMHVIAGGAIARPFVTHHNALDMPLYMRIAPELHLKRIVIGGLSEKVYEINRCFRNEGVSPKHNPEFTSIEIYQAYVDFTTMIDITEKIIEHVVMTLHGTTKISYGDKEIEFAAPWPRKSMVDLITEHTGLDLYTYPDATAATEATRAKGLKIQDGLSWGQIVETVFGDHVEDKLIQPTHVIDLPKEISPLSKAWPDRHMLPNGLKPTSTDGKSRTPLAS